MAFGGLREAGGLKFRDCREKSFGQRLAHGAIDGLLGLGDAKA